MEQTPIEPAGNISAVILCGGRGSRMGGRDKGLVPYHGRPLIEWVLEAIRPQVGEILLSANRNPALYRTLGYPVLPDLLPDYAGPLAGLSAALEHARHEWVLVIPCDTPHLPPDLATRLYAAARGQASFAADAERDHPVIHLFRRRDEPLLHRYLASGGASVKGWLAELKAARALFDCAAAFRNINRTEDLLE